MQATVACGANGSLSRAFPSDITILNYTRPLSRSSQILGGLYQQAYEFAFKRTPAIDSTPNEETVERIHEGVKPHVWYINTLVQPEIVSLARKAKVPCILHTHESASSLWLLGSNNVDDVINYPRVVIATSRHAAEPLRRLGRRDKLEVCHAPIDIASIKADPTKSRGIKQHLGIPGEAFVWAMSGSRDPNKNPVAFVEIANEMLKVEPQTHFLWIGGADTAYSLYAKALVNRQNSSRISWIGHRTADYFDYLNLADAFVLTSSEESLSLATLEAAALGKPFVSFNSGGPEEIFREGMGIIIDSRDTKDMVQAMRQVMHNEVYLNPDISRGRALEFDVSNQVKLWENILYQYFTAQ